MKRLTVTLLLIAAGFSLASADAERTSLMRQAAERQTQEMLSSTVEPAPQGISTFDLITTRDLNQEIASMPDLSPAGKDVRVGTYRGRITLTGTVPSPAEKRRIEELAGRRVGSANVVSEIEVRSDGRS